MTNPGAGTLTVLDGVRSVTFAVPATVGTVTTSAIFNGLPSDGSIHPISVSLSSCSSTSRSYMAPASCTVCSTSITTASLPNGQVGTAYSQTIIVTGGTAPYTYAVLGTLPAGLSLSPTMGVISGTPASAATSSFTVVVTDSKSCSDVQP